jgi:hypothetical protein
VQHLGVQLAGVLVDGETDAAVSELQQEVVGAVAWGEEGLSRL